MLTLAMLKANTSLTGLSDDQLNAIVTMSKNDEEVVIGQRIGQLHGDYDKDILAVTSIEKKEGEKSYDYMKRVLKGYKADADKYTEAKRQLDEANANVEKLQKQIDGGESEIAKQLKDEKDLTKKLQGQLTEKTTELANTTKDYEAKLLSYRVDAAFETVFNGLNFRPDITEAVKKAMMSAARAEVLAKGTLSFDEAKNALVLRDDKGEIVRNQANNMEPYTLSQLVGETSIKDVLQVSKGGNGTTPPSGGSGGKEPTILDLGGAKTQKDADNAITTYLEAKGFTRESDEYWTQYNQLREDNNVAALPLR